MGKYFIATPLEIGTIQYFGLGVEYLKRDAQICAKYLGGYQDFQSEQFHVILRKGDELRRSCVTRFGQKPKGCGVCKFV